MNPDYSPVPTSALVALGVLILKRARLSLRCTSREQAIAIIRGVRPAPSRKAPHGIRPRITRCAQCHGAIEVGTPCDALGTSHIDCQGGDHERCFAVQSTGA